ncbi:PREDICTED: GBF-interacting protein 1-like [Ipomoea nil]|uniref:GBF-interacting protein 1-like n=1 Tax=Ipomoea nil TaxID=35883 RepID=UPI0009019F84|nr:PREDICTED: GBF-interacting protein 1-like [Ipomoea nil]
MSNGSSMNSGAGGGAASRVSIASNVRETIRQIKEITGNHSEEEIYAMLKECSMDPNETTQKLLFQDTFHEVKKKRDRKKENMNKGFAKPNWKPGMQGCWNKGGHGNYPSHYASHDSGRGKNSGKENQTSQMLEKSISRTSVPTLREEKSISSLSIALPNGSSSGSSGSDAGDVSGKLEGQQCPAPIDARKSPKVGQCTRDTHRHPSMNGNTATSTALVPSSRAYFSTSDPVLLSSQDSQSIGTVEGLRCELGSQHVPVKHAPSDSNDSKTPSASIAKDWKLKAANANSAQASDAGTSAELSMVSVEAQTERKPRPDVMELQKKLKESMNILEVRHVIIPSHFQVLEAEKLGFCFGSFDANYYLDTNSNNVPQDDKKPLISKTTEHIEETAREQFPRNESELTTVDVDVAEDFDHPQLSSHGQENPPSKGDEVLPSAPKYKILKQESVHGGQQHSAVHTSPNYSFGFMPPILGSQLRSFDSCDSQTSDVSCPPNFVGGSHLVSSTAAATPLVTQLSGLMQSSIGVTQPPLPLFRQPAGVHLPHYIPYGHYLLPFYIAPLTIQQLFSNGSLPQQPLAGSLYPPPPPPPPPVAKYLPSQYKQGSNSANVTHIGAPGNYGPHDSTANYNPASATVGNPSSNDENSASQFKASSFYSSPRGQVAFTTPPQPVHGTASGLYHPVPPVTTPTVHPLLQQSQLLAGPLDIVGPAASIYHQPLHSHITWPSSY